MIRVGSVSDMLGLLKANLPNSWFGDDTPVLDSVLSGPAWLLAQNYSLIEYVRAQTRIETATDRNLEFISSDFLGHRLPRRAGEKDDEFRFRIAREILRPRATRAALAQMLLDLTEHEPWIFEPTNPRDTGGYGWHGMTAGTGMAYSGCGGYGSLALPYQCFVHAFRPDNIGGIAGVQGYRTAGDKTSRAIGGWGVGAIEYAVLDQITGAVTDDDIYAAIVSVLPESTVAWTNIGLDGIVDTDEDSSTNTDGNTGGNTGGSTGGNTGDINIAAVHATLTLTTKAQVTTVGTVSQNLAAGRPVFTMTTAAQIANAGGGTGGDPGVPVDGGGGSARILVAPGSNDTIYVDPIAGSDTHNGATASTPLKTLQKAWDTIVANYDLNGQQITVHCEGGTYTAGVNCVGTLTGGYAQWPVRFSGVSANVHTSFESCFVANGNNIYVSGFTVATDAGGSDLSGPSLDGCGLLAINSGVLSWEQMTYGSCARFHIAAGNYSTCYLAQPTTDYITGSAGAHMAAFDGSTVLVYIEGATLVTVLQNQVTFGDGYAFANTGGSVEVDASLVSYDGTEYQAVNTSRYVAMGGGGVYIQNGNDYAFPGDNPGWTMP